MDSLPGIGLELVNTRLLDGRVQQLIYVPTVVDAPVGGGD